MNLDDLVSKKIALREVNDGYAALKEGSLNPGRRHIVLKVDT
jgi:Zn-dependent alcohol dehydrogenase